MAAQTGSGCGNRSHVYQCGCFESHRRKPVDRSLLTYPETPLPQIPPAEAGGSFTPDLPRNISSRIPPAEAGGSFTPNLPRNTSSRIPPAEAGGSFTPDLPRNTSSPNPTSGSWWIVHSRPTQEHLLPNPTSGSWWIVHSQPTQELLLPESHQRKLVDRSLPTYPGTAPPRIPPAEAGGSFTPNLLWQIFSVSRIFLASAAAAALSCQPCSQRTQQSTGLISFTTI